MKLGGHQKQTVVEMGGGTKALWIYTSRQSGKSLQLRPPVFEVEGHTLSRVSGLTCVSPPIQVAEGIWETRFSGTYIGRPHLHLDLIIRQAGESPVVRFQYRLRSDQAVRLTKTKGADAIDYMAVSLAGFPVCHAISLGEFDEGSHSYRLSVRAVHENAFANRLNIIGPILVAEGAGCSVLMAYEHGAQAPDTFLTFRPDPTHTVTLSATKGNYWDGQVIDPSHAFETPWMQIAAIEGSISDMAQQYRRFVLRHMSLNAASRTPYVFYNTWCFQERNKWWNKKTFLASMNEKRMEAEIDVASRMGVDVFVLDTGWYEKTGDWRENRTLFPKGIKALSSRLKRKQMKLGLWFSPTHAALTSRVFDAHRDCIMMRDGKPDGPFPIWETEDSYGLCLVSRYWEAFADELIRLTREFGVTYFKWDAIGQYCCNSPDHDHGTSANTPWERAQSYAFLQVRYMCKVIDKLCAACPEAIVDFDITEAGRTVGLAFLASGKYFLINNGPYFPNLDHPFDWATATTWGNVYVYPGMARPHVCRTPLDLDTWIPSVLFLTHYLPDDPADSQLVNLASLVLGQNGVWGDLLSVSKEGVKRFGDTLRLYKQVRDDITLADPVRSGITGGSPEVHEKINPETGRGVVVVFASVAGSYSYVTSTRVSKNYRSVTGDVTVSLLKNKTARLDLRFEKPGARMVVFGVKPTLRSV
jgi:alpha-galactosidase